MIIKKKFKIMIKKLNKSFINCNNFQISLANIFLSYSIKSPNTFVIISKYKNFINKVFSDKNGIFQSWRFE